MYFKPELAKSLGQMLYPSAIVPCRMRCGLSISKFGHLPTLKMSYIAGPSPNVMGIFFENKNHIIEVNT